MCVLVVRRWFRISGKRIWVDSEFMRISALPQALHGLAPFPLTRLSDRKNSLNMVSSEFERRHMKRQTNALSQITAGW